ncbi:MAG: hypothetical protein R3C08_11710 [Hyphomonas sp.]
MPVRPGSTISGFLLHAQYFGSQGADSYPDGAGCRTRTRDPLITKMRKDKSVNDNLYNYKVLELFRNHRNPEKHIKNPNLRASCAPVSYANLFESRLKFVSMEINYCTSSDLCLAAE